MFRLFLCSLVCFVGFSLGCMAGVDEVVEEMYGQVDPRVTDAIFVNKDSVRLMLGEIDKSYAIGLNAVNSFKDLNKNMQAKLIRGRSVERFDIKHGNKHLCSIRFFRAPSFKPEHAARDGKNFVVLGSTVGAMRSSLGLVSGVGAKKVIILVGDRPIVVEEFGQGEAGELEFVEFLARKTPAYGQKQKEVLEIIKKYNSTKGSSVVPFARFEMYVDLAGLVDLETKKKGVLAVAKLHEAFKKHGVASKEFARAIAGCRKFVYTEALKVLPSEKDIAEYVVEDYGILAEIIETKTKFISQDRATTFDTYVTFLKYTKEHSLDMSNFVIVNVWPYTYRQWAELVAMCVAAEMPIPGFVLAPGECSSNDLFVDELARLFFTLNNIIKHEKHRRVG